MSADDLFRNVDWEDVLYKLTVRARHLFAAARLKGYGNALARTCVEADDLARSVALAALQGDKVKYKSEKGASLTTFLVRVLEDDFKDLLRKGMRLARRLEPLDVRSQDQDLSPKRGVERDLGDEAQGAKLIYLRAAALQAAKGDKELEEYITAAFDDAAHTRADQATFLKVRPSDITNRRKKLMRLLTPKKFER